MSHEKISNQKAFKKNIYEPRRQNFQRFYDNKLSAWRAVPKSWPEYTTSDKVGKVN